MKTYTVHAKRWEHGWELHIDGVGVTQSHGLADAERMARSYITMMTDTAPDAFTVTITPEVGSGLDDDLAAARDAQQAAEEAQRRAAQKYRTVAGKLKARGLSGRDISTVLGVSPQRVSQLLQPAAAAKATPKRATKIAAASALTQAGKSGRTVTARKTTAQSGVAAKASAGKRISKAK